MPEQTQHAEVPAIHKSIARIGTLLSTSGRKTQRHDMRVLKFGPNLGSQYGAVPAEITNVIIEARNALFGSRPYDEAVPGVVYAPQYDPNHGTSVPDADKDLPRVRLDSPEDTRLVHNFWAEFTPRLDPTDDWTLLAGHLQHLYVELVTVVLAGKDPRPTLLKMVAMEPAVLAVERATVQARMAAVPYVCERSYVVMENWESDPKAAVQQIRDFVRKHVSATCTVSADPNGGYTIKPAGRPAISVASSEFLAVEIATGDVVTFAQVPGTSK